MDVRDDKQTPPVYRERLSTPLWWYLAAVLVSGLLGAEFATAVSGWITWVPTLILVPASLAVVWRWSSARLIVTRDQAGSDSPAGTELTVPGASLRLADVQQAITLTATDLRRLVGRHADPSAFLLIRSWIGPGVQLVLTDQAAALTATGDQPEIPYWVVSSRDPRAFLAAFDPTAGRSRAP